MSAREEMLARLIAQEVGQGADLVTLRAIVEEASELGASRMLARMGLDDATASRDMRELRGLLDAWRDARRSAWKAVVAWLVRVLLAGLLIGIAVRMGGMEALR
jgi:hypothetical protein